MDKKIFPGRNKTNPGVFQVFQVFQVILKIPGYFQEPWHSPYSCCCCYILFNVLSKYIGLLAHIITGCFINKDINTQKKGTKTTVQCVKEKRKLIVNKKWIKWICRPPVEKEQTDRELASYQRISHGKCVKLARLKDCKMLKMNKVEKWTPIKMSKENRLKSVWKRLDKK